MIKVYKATRYSDDAVVAIKKFRKDTPVVDIANELRILKKCAHKHVNGYVAAYVSENRVYLVLALCIGKFVTKQYSLEFWRCPFLLS